MTNSTQSPSELLPEALLDRFNQLLAQRENADTCTTYSGKIQEIGALFCDNRGTVRKALASQKEAKPAAGEAEALMREEAATIGFGNVRDILKGRGLHGPQKLEPGMHAWSYLCGLFDRIDAYLTQQASNEGEG